jgi:hypothetical protein
LNYEKLIELRIASNNFTTQDLSIFSKFVNLKTLQIGEIDKERIKNNTYNRFYGSLKHLGNLTKLEKLSIDNTDINLGLEYLS